MKEVCEKSGLTEKAIRIYMEQKLVEPQVEDGIYRKSYYFGEKDIERLKDISTLRSAGFSITEIKEMLDNPHHIAALVKQREEKLDEEIRKKQVVRETLQHMNIQEHSDVTKLADAIEPRSTYAKETPKEKMSRKQKWFLILGVMSVILGGLYLSSGEAAVMIPLMAFGIVFGLISVVSAFRYGIESRKPEKMNNRAEGNVTAVISNERIEEYIGTNDRSTWKELISYLVFGMFGEGIWESVRPDCWYPLVTYQTEDGELHMATSRYGGLKKDWTIGEKLEIAWEEGKEKLIYEVNGKRLGKKATRHIILGLILFALSGICARMLFSDNSNLHNQETARKTWEEHLEQIETADRIIISSQSKTYELDETEREVLLTQLKGLTIAEGKRHFGVAKGATIRFFRDEEEIERYIVGDFSYITTGHHMRYKVVPIKVELDGTKIEETTYITAFLFRFTEKMLLKEARDEVLQKISRMENVDDLKMLLSEEAYYNGAEDLGNGYRFILSEYGFCNIRTNPEDELEYGQLWIRFSDDEMEAVLEVSYQTKDGSEETYRKQW